MAFDERLAERVRRLFGARRVQERKMFGGLAFLERGRMLCGVIRKDLVVRVGADRYEAAVARSHARPMTFTGRAIKSMVYVAPAGVRTEAMLKRWLDLAQPSAAAARSKRPAASPSRRPGRRTPTSRRRL